MSSILGRSTKGTVPIGVAILLALSSVPPSRLPPVDLVATCSSGPIVTGVSPVTGPTWGGAVLTIAGCGFTGATAVNFGGVAAASYTLDSDTQITATSPAQGAGKVDVTVATPAGTSATSPADVFSVTAPCQNMSASTDRPSPQPIGTSVNITVSATACPSPLYRFEMLPPGSQVWQVRQYYLPNATYSWDTASLPSGTYTWAVKARDASSTAVWDAFAMLAFDLYQPAVIHPCTSTRISAGPSSPQRAGTLVTVVVDEPSVTGCSIKRFQFELLAAGSTAWSIVQAYSPNLAYGWDTSGLTAGIYRFIVKARDGTSLGTNGGGNPNGQWDTYAQLSYSLTNGGPCTDVSGSSAPQSPQNLGTGVNITAAATGCPGTPRYQFEMQAPGSAPWLVVQSFSTNAVFNWNTGGLAAGTYRFILKAKDTASGGAGGLGNLNGSWDSYTMLEYMLNSTACAGLNASASPANTAATGTPVVITGSGMGCSSPQYQFEMLTPVSRYWQVVQAYGFSNVFRMETAGQFKGAYRFIVKTRDASSGGTAGAGNPNGTWDAYVMISYTLT